MHYDGHDVSPNVAGQLFQMVGRELDEHKPFAALLKRFQRKTERAAQIDDCAQPCNEVEFGLS
ncbi:MAG: hypothetical protein IAE80_14170 [Anaerolinea sp.]|nr:hypothetical protein [Anaerolinea sp.]